MMINEQAAIISQRLEVILAETERLHTALVAEGLHVSAQSTTAIALDLRLAQRQLSSLLRNILPPTTPFRPVILGGSERSCTA